MLHSKCVPRDLYDRKCADYDELLTKYHALKLAGATPPLESRPGRVVQAGPTAEELAQKRLHDSLVEDLARTLEGVEGPASEAAKMEARRLRAIALGGSITDPPV